MTNQDWSNLGNDIRNLVQSAIDSQDFQKLNETISRTINQAVEGVSQGLSYAEEKLNEANQKGKHRCVQPGQDIREKKKQDMNQMMPVRGNALFKSTAGTMGGGIALSVSGYTLAGGLGIAMMVLLWVGILGGFSVPLKVAAAFLPFTLAGGILGGMGTRMMRRVKRFRTYIGNFRNRSYCSLRELAVSVGKSESYVRRDIRDMLQRGMFLQGHLDKQETCLMVSHEAYDMYCTAQAQLEERQRLQIEGEKERQRAVSEPLDAGDKLGLPEAAQKVIREGEEYLRKIRTCRDAISGREIGEKISRMELIVQKIFQRVEKQPELVDELHKFMGYYLPTTVKLLEAYQDIAAQPVQGSNILSAREEIEGTLDTINQAFENLLDSFFQDKAWDISSDITVLQTMLAQEGLTGTDFNTRNTPLNS
ncbi:5-bromo-4-chloroindolyl phosphate hydrolysis family protein [Lachnospiraceae bacterium 46-15]